MPFYFFGPRLTGARVSSQRANRVVSPINAVMYHYTTSSMDSANFTATVANGVLGKGSQSSDNQCRMGNAGVDRYYIQFVDDDGVTQTAVSTTGMTGLPAIIAAHPVMPNYIVFRVVGSFGSEDVIYPVTAPGSTTAAYRYFAGGRG